MDRQALEQLFRATFAYMVFGAVFLIGMFVVAWLVSR
jgi:hypothetical protein